MAGDKNCVAHGINNSMYDSYNGVVCKTLGSPFHKRMVLPWWQWVKIIIMSLTIAPIRFLMVAFFLSVTWFLSSLATSTSDKQKPIKGWRLWVKALFCIFARCVFIAGGFHWVTTRGQRISVDEAPILVLAPHSSYLDALIIVYLGMCSVVGKEELTKVPLVGSLLLMTQPILVSREERHSRRKTVDEIQRRTAAAGSGWPQIAIFPEGTCTNRSCLIKFKLGAFIPGVPVQPVLIRWPNRVDTTVWTWDGPSTWTLLWMSLCQFHNRISVEYLPVYNPNAEERSDPSLFARNVQVYVSEHLRVPVSDYSYEDSRMLDLALKCHVPCASVLLELTRIEKLISLDQLKSLPKERIPTNLSLAEFSRILGVPESSILERVFHHYKNSEESSTMDFRRFLLDLVMISNPADPSAFMEWAFNKFCDDRMRISQRHAVEILATIYPSIKSKEKKVICDLSLESDTTISWSAMEEESQRLLQLNIDNVYLKFHERQTRLRQCY